MAIECNRLSFLLYLNLGKTDILILSTLTFLWGLLIPGFVAVVFFYVPFQSGMAPIVAPGSNSLFQKISISFCCALQGAICCTILALSWRLYSIIVYPGVHAQTYLGMPGFLVMPESEPGD